MLQKRLLPPSLNPISRLASACPLFAVLVTITVLLGLFLFSYPVRGQVPIEPPPDLTLDPTYSAARVQAKSQDQNGIVQGNIFTYTLPMLSKGYYWESHDSALGLQLYGIDWPIVVRTADIGASWVRIPLYWNSIEPANTTPDNYQWPKSRDAHLAHLSSKNVNVILTLSSNPSWAATYLGGPIDRADISELVEFMEAAVARYSAPPYNIKHWEIYNEADNGDEMWAEWGWGYFGNHPQEYVDLLAAIYEPIKAIDPGAQIVFSGIAYDWWTSSGGIFVESFVDDVLERDGDLYFDLMNFHYYPVFRDNWRTYGQGIIGKATYLRNKLAEYNVDKPFICTEASQWSDELHGGSDELQSRYVVQVFARSMAADLEATIWLKLVDNAGVDAWKYGLVHRDDLSPKPAYHAYQTAARQLALANYVRTLNDGETGSEWVEAYDFVTKDGLTHIIVAWTNDGANHEMLLVTDQVVVVDKMGAEIIIWDGDDGTVDGRVHVTIEPSPVYLRLSQ